MPFFIAQNNHLNFTLNSDWADLMRHIWIFRLNLTCGLPLIFREQRFASTFPTRHVSALMEIVWEISSLFAPQPRAETCQGMKNRTFKHNWSRLGACKSVPLAVFIFVCSVRVQHIRGCRWVVIVVAPHGRGWGGGVGLAVSVLMVA